MKKQKTKAQAGLARAIANRRREIEKERAAIQKELDAARPQIERLAATGTAEERRVARRWLDRVKSAMEVADGFKATLDKVLDTLMFAQHMGDKTGKRKGGEDA